MPLYIVATPIGNLGDITYRAVKLLSEVDLILAEDTRRTKVLLNHYSVKNKLESYNDMNKEKKTNYVIEQLKSGKNIALVSDCGTPGVSDPGFYLVRECVQNNIIVFPLPGANAAISALVCSGLPSDKFTFYGFLSKKEGKKTAIFNEIKENGVTAIIYESPYRIEKTLKLIAKLMPDHRICVAREMTKKFEEFIHGTADEILKNKETWKGELVVVL